MWKASSVELDGHARGLVNMYFYKHSNNLYYFRIETKVIMSPSKQLQGLVWLINVTCL